MARETETNVDPNALIYCYYYFLFFFPRTNWIPGRFKRASVLNAIDEKVATRMYDSMTVRIGRDRFEKE